MIVTLELTPADDITIGITRTVFCFHIVQFLVIALFFSYCFGEIICIPDSYVYQIGGLCFFIRESYVRSVSKYCLLLVFSGYIVS